MGKIPRLLALLEIPINEGMSGNASNVPNLDKKEVNVR
jgi:hypothetical protein